MCCVARWRLAFRPYHLFPVVLAVMVEETLICHSHTKWSLPLATQVNCYVCFCLPRLVSPCLLWHLTLHWTINLHPFPLLSSRWLHLTSESVTCVRRVSLVVIYLTVLAKATAHFRGKPPYNRGQGSEGFNWVTLYLKPLYVMHYKSSFNALILPCNVPYN